MLGREHHMQKKRPGRKERNNVGVAAATPTCNEPEPFVENEEESACHPPHFPLNCLADSIHQVLLMGASGSGKTSMRSLILCVCSWTLEPLC